MRMAVGSWRWRWAGLPRGWQCGVGEQSWGRYMAWLQSEPEGVEFSITEDVLTVVDVIIDSDTMVEFIGAIGLAPASGVANKGLGRPDDFLPDVPSLRPDPPKLTV